MYGSLTTIANPQSRNINSICVNLLAFRGPRAPLSPLRVLTPNLCLSQTSWKWMLSCRTMISKPRTLPCNWKAWKKYEPVWTCLFYQVEYNAVTAWCPCLSTSLFGLLFTTMLFFQRNWCSHPEACSVTWLYDGRRMRQRSSWFGNSSERMQDYKTSWQNMFRKDAQR